MTTAIATTIGKVIMSTIRGDADARFDFNPSVVFGGDNVVSNM